MYFTVERYTKRTRTIVEEKAAKKLGSLLNAISQDNQDCKQMMQTTLDAIKHVFIYRIESKNVLQY